MNFKRRLLILFVSAAMIVSPVTSWAQSLGAPISPSSGSTSGTGSTLPSNPNLGTQLPTSGGTTDTGHTAVGDSPLDTAANSQCADGTTVGGHTSTVGDSSTGSGHTSTVGDAGTGSGHTSTVGDSATGTTGHTSTVGDSATGTGPTTTPTSTLNDAATGSGHTGSSTGIQNAAGSPSSGAINCPTTATGSSSTSPSSGTASTSGVQSGSTYGPTEPPIELEVPDCPGVVRKIDASHLPPSIYPKPTCGTGGATTTGGPTGVCSLDRNKTYGPALTAPPANAVFWTITGGKTYPITQGIGDTSFSESAQGQSMYGYGAAYGVTGHPGVDVGTPEGTKLYTPVAGKVEIAGGTPYYDYNYIQNVPQQGELKIDLPNGDALILGHMIQIDVHVGDELKAGQYVGLSGGENGAHVHVEYRHYDPTWNGSSEHQYVLDPRIVFGCPDPSVSVGGASPTPTPSTTPASGSTASTVKASTAPATTMDQFEQKYGFFKPTGPSGRDFAKYSANFAAERDLAVKYAPDFNLEPQMVVWWTWAETAPPYDSWGYQNCHEDHGSNPITNGCSDPVGYGAWQLGYGQQFAEGVDQGMDKVFQKTHGDPNNATLVQQVGQNVLSKEGISQTFPTETVAQLMSQDAGSGNHWWMGVLQRDQAISVYLTAAEIAGDINGRPGETYYQITKAWGYSDSLWQDYSNVMNDVLTNWGLAASATPGLTCNTSTNAPAGSCSTEPDVLQGMTVDEFTQKINQNMADYKKIADCADVPWEMMAAINERETGLARSYGTGSGGAQGPWQIDPTSPVYGTVDPNDFVAAGCAAAKGDLQDKAINGPVGRPLHKTMNADNHDDMVSIKDAFFGYNGRGGWQGNVPKGCNPAFDGHSNWNFDCSGYVMNNMDENHKGMCIGTADGSQFCDPNDGTWKIYYKLVHSTYGPDGKLLVYGGACTLNNGVVNGIAIPTTPNNNILTTFFAKQPDGTLHHGVDIEDPVGAAVFALANGDVANSGWDPSGGYYILLHIPAKSAANTNERWVFYGHLDSTKLPAAGTQVTAGQQIATVGDATVQRNGQTVPNGDLTVPHLHFDIRTQTGDGSSDKQHVNPCSIDSLKQSYPGLNCSSTASLGVSWN